MIRLSWVVFLHAAILSAESITIELLATRLQFPPLAISAVSIPIAGAMLLLLMRAVSVFPATPSSLPLSPRGRSRTDIFSNGWKLLVPGSAFLAAGVFAWYDSVSRIGASKEGLLAGPIETVIVLLLARLLLGERFGRAQAAGVVLALGGFFMTAMSGGSPIAAQDHQLFTLGDAEAVLSAASFAAGVIFMGRLARSHRAIEVTGASLLVSGLILFAALWTTEPMLPSLFSTQNLGILAAFSLMPMAAALSYVVGLARIGASLTSTIASFSILLTVVLQLAMMQLGIDIILPASISLAVAGGALGVLGIYIIHRSGRQAPAAAGGDKA